MEECGLETRPEALGITTGEDVEQILREVNLERLNNNPMRVTRDMLKAVLTPERFGTR